MFGPTKICEISLPAPRKFGLAAACYGVTEDRLKFIDCGKNCAAVT